MKFIVYWKEIPFLKVKKLNNVYYSHILAENIEKIKEEGYPITFITNIKAMDHKLPKLIQNRLPSIEYMCSQLEDTTNTEQAIIEYINKTKCERVTDFLSLEIEE